MHRARTLFRYAVCSATFLVFLNTACGAHANTQEPQGSPQRILILSSYDSSRPEVIDFNLGFLETTTRLRGTGVEIFWETLDRDRFERPRHQYEKVFDDYIRGKYSGHSVDAVLLLGPEAVLFYKQYGESLWPAAPVVFAALTPEQVTQFGIPNTWTGLTMKFEFKETIAEAKKLLPATESVVVAYGCTTRSDFERDFLINVVHSSDPTLKTVDFGCVSSVEFARKLSQLPPHTIVLWGFLGRDRLRQMPLPEEIARQTIALANVPAFTTFKALVESGAAGGRVPSEPLTRLSKPVERPPRCDLPTRSRKEFTMRTAVESGNPQEIRDKLKPILFLQLFWVAGAALWNVAGVVRISQGLSGLGPTASLRVAGLLVVTAILLIYGWRRHLLLYGALSALLGAMALMTVVGAFTRDPSLWPSEFWRYGGSALNLLGTLSAPSGIGMAAKWTLDSADN